MTVLTALAITCYKLSITLLWWSTRTEHLNHQTNLLHHLPDKKHIQRCFTLIGQKILKSWKLIWFSECLPQVLWILLRWHNFLNEKSGSNFDQNVDPSFCLHHLGIQIGRILHIQGSWTNQFSPYTTRLLQRTVHKARFAWTFGAFLLCPVAFQHFIGILCLSFSYCHYEGGDIILPVFVQH